MRFKKRAIEKEEKYRSGQFVNGPAADRTPDGHWSEPFTPGK
ncbi:hypothetical protein [Paenibacillus sp. TH7-28]